MNFAHLLNELGSASRLFSSLWMNAWLQGLVLVALMGLFTVALRVRPLSSTRRYALWWTCLVVVALLPMLRFIGTVDRPTRISEASRLSVAAKTATTTPLPSSDKAVTETLSGPSEATRNIFQIPHYLAMVFVALWLTGAVRGVVQLARAQKSARRLARLSAAAPAELVERLNYWRDRAGFERCGRIELRVSTAIRAPVSMGIFQPTILFPASVVSDERFSLDELDGWLLHELAHIRRYDVWANLLERMIRILYPFNPAITIATRRLRLEREIACDAFVVRWTKRPIAYAASLVRLAERRAPAAALVSHFSRSRSQLPRRIDMLLNEKDRSKARDKYTLWFGALAILAVGFACSKTAPVTIESRQNTIQEKNADLVQIDEHSIAVPKEIKVATLDREPERVVARHQESIDSNREARTTMNKELRERREQLRATMRELREQKRELSRSLREDLTREMRQVASELKDQKRQIRKELKRELSRNREEIREQLRQHRDELRRQRDAARRQAREHRQQREGRQQRQRDQNNEEHAALEELEELELELSGEMAERIESELATLGRQLEAQIPRLEEQLEGLEVQLPDLEDTVLDAADLALSAIDVAIEDMQDALKDLEREERRP